MKKFLSTIIASAVSLSCSIAYASPFSALPVKLYEFEDSELTGIKDALVSISLSAGSTTMTLNGEEVEITAPYVTDEGVTLVPLRVITEAFGAEVVWDEETQSINITYEEVNLKLAIGSKAAVINEHAEELESAPELKDGTTMVPLRFISETFGADVKYDAEFGIVTVTLYDSEEAEMIRGMHDKDYIGDSYHEWSMKTPRNMRLSYRSFDGTYLSFYDDYSNYINISVDDTGDADDINAIFQTKLDNITYGVITGAEKGTDSNGNPMFSLSTKSSYSKSYCKLILKGNKTYTITVSSYSYEDSEEADTAYENIISLIDSFAVGVHEDMYDFSDIKDGVREYENEELKLSFSIPKSYTEEEYSISFNEIEFASYDEETTGGLSLKIYSKNETVTKNTFAETQHEIDTSVFNPETITVGEFDTVAINETDAVAYTITGETDDYAFTIKKIFFELGEYVYILSILDTNEEVCQSIIDSFKAEELDYDEIGPILCRRDLMESYTYIGDNYKIVLPKYWSASYYAIKDERTGSILLAPEIITDEDVDEMLSSISKEDGVIAVQPLKWTATPNGKYPEAVFKKTEENAPDTYIIVTGRVIGGDVFAFVYAYSELYSGSIIEDDFTSIINSCEKIQKK